MPCKRNSHIVFRLLAMLWFAVAPLAAPPATAQPANHIRAELVAEGPAVPGETIELALHFRPAAGWHGYWSNPGDAGFGMNLEWSLPSGWSIGSPRYPVPHRLVIAGLMNHVYEGDYAVLLPLKVPSSASTSSGQEIRLAADWLACTDEICVPEHAELTLRLQPPGVAQRDVRFDAWRSAIPPLLDSPAAFALTGQRLRIAIPLPSSLALDDPHVFIANDGLIDYAAPQRFTRQADKLIADIALRGTAPPEEVSGILKLDDMGGGVTFVAGPGAVPAGGKPLAGLSGQRGSYAWLLLAALAGGLILNIMPCVFPILSLKALSLARAGSSDGRARADGLAYTAGVVLACVALGGLLLALRAGGQQIGWAFQLQEPGIVVALLALAVAITANFAGLFELPSFSLTRGGQPAGSFATGLLAAFVATPCTGPFMAAALGAALLLPALPALLLFAALGLGLALPFLALGFIPPLRRMLPRPGAWMERFRRLMAVPMALTALALLWLVWRLGGAGLAILGIALAFGFTTLLVLAGRWRNQGRATIAPALLGTFALLSLGYLMVPAAAEPPGDERDAGLIAAKPFSDAALARARTSGHPVFVWFTADWCLTCKVNENVAIERKATADAFAAAGVVALEGDWTRRDPAITRFLTAHGVAGVPLYLWYPAGGPAQILPQVLAPDVLVSLAQKPGAKPSPIAGSGTATGPAVRSQED